MACYALGLSCAQGGLCSRRAVFKVGYVQGGLYSRRAVFKTVYVIAPSRMELTFIKFVSNYSSKLMGVRSHQLYSSIKFVFGGRTRRCLLEHLWWCGCGCRCAIAYLCDRK